MIRLLLLLGLGLGLALGVDLSPISTSGYAAIPAVAVAGIAANVEPIFISIAAAAATLATSKSEIYQRIARGELEAVKDGSRTKITWESVKRVAPRCRRPA
jgi:excisionase family DNA binding protein